MMGAPPPGGTGAATVPSNMAGAAAKAGTQVKLAVEMLQHTLPGIPMGSELHSAILKAVADISKHLDKGPDDASQIVQQLSQLARSQQQNPQQQQAMQRLFPQPAVAGAGAPPTPAPPPAAAA
jgi:hypothetical protein